MSASRSAHPERSKKSDQGLNTGSSSLTRHKDRRAVHETMIKRREEGWNNSTLGELPKYNAASDKNCPMSVNRNFNMQQKRMQAERLQKVMSQDSSKWIKQNISNRLNEVPEIMYKSADAEASHYSATNEEFGLPRKYQPLPTQADVPDTAILHKIVVRENLITEIKKLLEHQLDLDTIRNEVLELIRAVRYETMEIVLGIKEWRKGQLYIPKEFLFKGKNYLVKINSDLDFLDNVDDLGLGFPITGNPLVFPYYNGRSAPEPLRIGSLSALSSYDPKSGAFTSSGSHGSHRDVYVEQMDIDGIDIRTLMECDRFIRDEIALRSNKKLLDSLYQQHSQVSMLQQGQKSSMLGTGERRIMDPSATGSGGGGKEEEQHHVSFSEGQHCSHASVSDHRGSVSFDDQPVGFEPSESLLGGEKSRPERELKHPSISVPVSSKLQIQQSKFGTSVRPSQINQMRVRIDAMAEEIEVLRVMMAHVEDKVEYKTKEESELVKIRSTMENRWRLAMAQNKPVKASELAIKLNVMDTEIDGVKHEMKDLNRQIFFFDLEIKRKRKMISKLRNDIEKSKRVAKLKKEINARVGNNESFLSALELDGGEGEEGNRFSAPHDADGGVHAEIAAPGGGTNGASETPRKHAYEQTDDADVGADVSDNDKDIEGFSGGPTESLREADSEGGGGEGSGVFYEKASFDNKTGDVIAREGKNDASAYSKLDASYYDSIEDPGEGYGDDDDVVLSLSQKHINWRQEMEAMAVAKRAEEQAWAEAERALAERRAAEAALEAMDNEEGDDIKEQDDNQDNQDEEAKEKGGSHFSIEVDRFDAPKASTMGGGTVAGSGLAVVRSVRESVKGQGDDNSYHRTASVPQAQTPSIEQTTPLPTSFSSKSTVDDRAEEEQSMNGKWYNSVVKGDDFKSFLVHRGDGVEIHSTNCMTGEKRIIPLMPVLAKQIPTLSEARISNVVTDILKALL